MSEKNKLTPEEAKNIVQSYFHECMERMDFQLATADIYSTQMIELAGLTDRLSALKNIDHTQEALRLDFLLPNNFKYDTSGKIKSMALTANNFTANKKEVVSYLIGKNNLKIAPGTMSYKALSNSTDRAIKELKRIHNEKADMQPDVEIKDEWFMQSGLEIFTGHKVKRGVFKNRNKRSEEIHNEIKKAWDELRKTNKISPTANAVWNFMKKRQNEIECISHFEDAKAGREAALYWQSQYSEIKHRIQTSTFANLIAKFNSKNTK